MKYLSAKILFLFILAFFTLIIFLIFLKSWSFPDANWPLSRIDKIDIPSEKTIIQKFEASRNNLARIELLFSQSSKNKIGGEIKIQLAKENCSTTIKEDFLKVSSVNSEFTYDFTFLKIKDSKNKIFCLLLNFTPEEKSAGLPKIFTVANSLSENKGLFDTNGQELKNQSLSMRPAYKNDTIWQDATELNKRISQYKPWFLKHYYLTIITALFLVLSLFLVFILISL